MNTYERDHPCRRGCGAFLRLRKRHPGEKVLVVGAGPRPAPKILVSGGGRCNFTNRNVTSANYVQLQSPFVNPLSPATPRRISSPWSRPFPSLFMRKKTASCSATRAPSNHPTFGRTGGGKGRDDPPGSEVGKWPKRMRAIRSRRTAKAIGSPAGGGDRRPVLAPTGRH